MIRPSASPFTIAYPGRGGRLSHSMLVNTSKDGWTYQAQLNTGPSSTSLITCRKLISLSALVDGLVHGAQ